MIFYAITFWLSLIRWHYDYFLLLSLNIDIIVFSLSAFFITIIFFHYCRHTDIFIIIFDYWLFHYWLSSSIRWLFLLSLFHFRFRHYFLFSFFMLLIIADAFFRWCWYFSCFDISCWYAMLPLRYTQDAMLLRHAMLRHAYAILLMLRHAADATLRYFITLLMLIIFIISLLLRFDADLISLILLLFSLSLFSITPLLIDYDIIFHFRWLFDIIFLLFSFIAAAASLFHFFLFFRHFFLSFFLFFSCWHIRCWYHFHYWFRLFRLLMFHYQTARYRLSLH